MIFKKKRSANAEDDYPGIRNLKQRNKLNCTNHFIREQSAIENERQKERSENREFALRQWFRQKLDQFVDNSLNFFDDQEVHYNDERNKG